MNAGEKVSGGSEAHQYMVKLAFEAMKVTAVLNQGYHEPEEIFVITKLYPNQFANAEEAIDEALDKLDIEYIDMMLLHHPGDHDVEAYQAMEQAVEEGKICSIGLSNWYVEELTEFLPQITITPALVQNEIHPYYQENDVIPGSGNPEHIRENIALFDFELSAEEMKRIAALDKREKHDWY